MSVIAWTIEPRNVEWEMDWGNKPETFSKTGKEKIFEPDIALAHLLLNEVVFTNSHWWKHFKMGAHSSDGWKMEPREDATWSEEESKTISVSVECNDIFAWGCSDAETLPHAEIEKLYRMWRLDPEWGPAVWCMVKRNQMPQSPVEKAVRKAGIWDLDALRLGQNTQEAEVSAYLSTVLAAKLNSPPAGTGE